MGCVQTGKLLPELSAVATLGLALLVTATEGLNE